MDAKREKIISIEMSLPKKVGPVFLEAKYH